MALDALQTITALSNDVPTHPAARELVIRMLAAKDLLRDDFHPLLDGLIRSVGLIPYADPDNARSLDDHYLMEAHRAPIPDEEEYFFLTLHLQIYRDHAAGRNVVLRPTTRVGRSIIVQQGVG